MEMNLQNIGMPSQPGYRNADMVSLPMIAFDEIPNPRADAKAITAVVRDNGRVSGYQLSDGRCVSKDEGVRMAHQGEIRGVGIARRKGSYYLKSLPDGTQANNLGNLPAISMKGQ